jgi:hypothetical protein
MQTIIRPDFIFSYWIFVWFILYFTHSITISPKLWLWISLVENIVSIFFMLHSKFYYILRFIVINFFIKMIPLYLLWKEPIRKSDIVYSGIVFIVYNLWLFINNMNVYIVYKMLYHAQLDKSNYIGLMSYLYDKLYK